MPSNRLDPSALIQLLGKTADVTWTYRPDTGSPDVSDWSLLTGQTAENSRGDGWMDAVHPQDVERVSAAWSTSLSHGNPYNTDYRLKCADGIYRWYNVRGVAIENEAGNIEQWVGVILSIPGAHRHAQADFHSVRGARGARIPPHILRATRAMLGWTVDDVASQSGLSLSTIRRMESDDASVQTRQTNFDRLIEVFCAEGIRFVREADELTGLTRVTSSPASSGDDPAADSGSNFH